MKPYKYFPAYLCCLLLLISSSINAGQTDEFVVTNSNNAGPGSLRDAIAMANASSNDVDIDIDPAISTINITTGPLELTTMNTVQITSLGTPTILDANSNSRILIVTNPDNTLILRNLHLIGGQTTADATLPATCAASTGHGGALCTLGELDLRTITISNNQTFGEAAHGGAIFVAGELIIRSGADVFSNSTHGDFASGGAIYAAAEILIFQSLQGNVFEANRANGISSLGGAIFAPRFTYSGTVTGAAMTFIQNEAAGGGVLASSGCGNFINTISSALFDSNIAAVAGGAIYQSTDCPLNIEHSEFIDNHCQDGGGGAIATERSVVIESTLFDGNSCSAPGGAIMGRRVFLNDANIIINNEATGDQHHGGAIATVDLELINSTVAFNTTNGREAHGGSIWVTGEMDIRNSTITGNQTLAPNSDGGALYYSGDDQGLMISNVTLIGNQASRSADGIFINPEFDTTAAELTIISTVLADNGSSGDNFELVDRGIGHIVNVVQSVFGDSSSEITGSNVANVLDNRPAFRALANNGCFVPAGVLGNGECPHTFMPENGSVMLDAGDNPNGEISDQRGFTFPRTFNLVTDIGALEVSPEPSISASVEWIDFGTVIADPQNNVVSDSFSIESDGPGLLHILGIGASGNFEFSALDDCDQTLLVGETCNISVEVDTSRTDYGTNEEFLVSIFSDAPGSPLDVPVFITVITGAELVANPGSTQFQDTPVDVPSPIETLTLTNTGSQPLDIESAFAGGPFDITSNGCTQPVPAQGACTIDLQFTPFEPGIVIGELLIRSNSVTPDNDAFIPLRGTSGIVFSDGFE